MKVVYKKDEKIKVTRWMLLKAKSAAKWILVKAFLIKFFDIKQHAYAFFAYDIICKHKNPKRQEFVALAKISRNATPEEITKALFTIKPDGEDCKYKVVDVKIKPIGKIKSV